MDEWKKSIFISENMKSNLLKMIPGYDNQYPPQEA